MPEAGLPCGTSLLTTLPWPASRPPFPRHRSKGEPIGPQAGSSWLRVVPDAIYKITQYASERYDRPEIRITGETTGPCKAAGGCELGERRPVSGAGRQSVVVLRGLSSSAASLLPNLTRPPARPLLPQRTAFLCPVRRRCRWIRRCTTPSASTTTGEGVGGGARGKGVGGRGGGARHPPIRPRPDPCNPSLPGRPPPPPPPNPTPSTPLPPGTTSTTCAAPGRTARASARTTVRFGGEGWRGGSTGRCCRRADQPARCWAARPRAALPNCHALDSPSKHPHTPHPHTPSLELHGQL
jgi:hypothetical protein